MALPENHPLSELVVAAQTSSLGATPVTVYTRAPFRGKILKVGVVYQGALTGGPGALTVQTNNSGSFANVTGGVVTLTAGAAGIHASAIPSGANDVNEDDVISFAPTGNTGASIGGLCYAVIRRA